MSPLVIATLATSAVLAGGVTGAVSTVLTLRYAETAFVGRLLGVRPPQTGSTEAQPPRGHWEGGTRHSSVRASSQRTRLCDRHRESRPSRQANRGPLLTDSDHRALETELQRHATGMRQQVSAYADLLAGDDEVLRARLRRFEREGNRP